MNSHTTYKYEVQRLKKYRGMTGYSDADLVSMFQEQERQQDAFRAIVAQYRERLYWHIRKLVLTHENTDDVLQNVFVKVWKGLANFRSDSQLFTWLYRIATNESLTFLKQQKKHQNIDIDSRDNQVNNQLMSDPYFDGDLLQIKLQQAISQLPEKQRAVFNLRYFEEMKYEDMSKILETSVGALKASYHHACKKVERFFEENG